MPSSIPCRASNNMPKTSGRHRASEQNLTPYSCNILRRIGQTSRWFRGAASSLPIARQPLVPLQSYRHSLGPCNVVCPSCRALHWIQERSYESTINEPLFFTCCQKGRIALPLFPDAPEPLRSLLREQTNGISFIRFTYRYILMYIFCFQLQKPFVLTFEIITMHSPSRRLASISTIRFMDHPASTPSVSKANSFIESGRSSPSRMIESHALLRYISTSRILNVRLTSGCLTTTGFWTGRLFCSCSTCCGSTILISRYL